MSNKVWYTCGVGLVLCAPLESASTAAVATQINRGAITQQDMFNAGVALVSTLIPCAILVWYMLRTTTLASGRKYTAKAFKGIGEKDYCGGFPQRLREIVGDIRDGAFFDSESTPKGVILYGPPGTGKSFLAKCFAGETGLPAYVVSGPGFLGKYHHETAENICKLFRAARKEKSCLVIIDEIDAVGTSRDKCTHKSEREESNALLSQIAGLYEGIQEEQNEEQNHKKPNWFARLFFPMWRQQPSGKAPGIFVIACTNRFGDLDPALIREGRLGIHIEVGPLTYKQVGIMLLHQLRKNKLIASDKEEEVKGISELVNQMCNYYVQKGSKPITADGIKGKVDTAMNAVNRFERETQKTLSPHDKLQAVLKNIWEATTLLPNAPSSGGKNDDDDEDDE